MAYLLFWGAFAYIAVARRTALLAALFCSMSFDTFAVLPPALTHGISIVPRVMLTLMLLVNALARPGGLSAAWSAAVSPRKLGFLTAFILAALFATIFMPRIFAGRVVVVGLNTGIAELLRPSAGLYTQAIYLLLSYFLALAVCLATEQPGGRSVLVDAVVVGALTAALTGALDVTTHGTGLLDPFRNATYQLMITGEILGRSRIVGLMSEASAYGGLTAGLGAGCYFLARTLDPGTRWGKVARVTPFAALAMAAFSTSSTAILAVGMFVVVATLDWTIRALRAGSVRDRTIVFGQLVAVGLIALAVWLAMILLPDLFRPAIDMVDRMVFHKADSQSYIVRSMWNGVSLQAFVATHQFGVGLGGTRTSSWPVALLSCTGTAGASLMAAFLLRFMTASAAGGHDGRLLYNAKLTWLVAFVPGAVASPTASFGYLSAALFGVMAGVQVATTATAPINRSRRSCRARRDARPPFIRRTRAAHAGATGRDRPLTPAWTRPIALPSATDPTA